MARITSRLALFVAGLVAAAFGGIATASVLTDEPQPPQLDPTPIPGTEVHEGRASDPHGGPPWTVDVYTSRDGRRCMFAAQVQDGAVGFVGLDGVFREAPPVEASSCGSDARLSKDAPLAAHLSSRRTEEGGVVMVWGTALGSVTEVTVETPFGSRTLTPATGRGGFIAVFDGNREELVGKTVTLRARNADGSAAQEEFQVSDRESFPAGNAADHAH